MKRSIRNLNGTRYVQRVFRGAASVMLIVGGAVTDVRATEPCDDFGECRALIEINSTDGDIGFHWLIDGDDLESVRMDDPNGKKVYENKASGPLRDQKLTETFGESAEPICKEALKEDEDDVVVTVMDFAERWASGPYTISGKADGGEKLFGATHLTYFLPAAPENLTFTGHTISWMAGTTLGECATEAELDQLVADGVLPIHPKMVPLAAWEVVLEVEDGSQLKFSIRLPVGQTSVTLPAEFLAQIPANTPAKAEVGAIGGDLSIGDDDNATFTELVGLCLNAMGDGCPEGEE
jgi:hypothetical protein